MGMLRGSLAFIFLATLLFSESMLFIANDASGIEALSRKELRQIYLKKRRFWKETKLVPLNLPPQNRLRQQMEKKILTMSASALDAYWMQEHYRGHRPPYRLESVKSMILFVKKVKGAIGYIPESQLVPGVKVLYRMPK